MSAYRPARVIGRKALTRRLTRHLPEDIARELADTLLDGAKAIQAEAVTRAPVRTGNLRRQLLAKGAIKVLNKGLQVKFGIRGVKAARQAFYAGFLEFGTKGFSGIDRRGRRVSIPPMAARPFMRPAYDAQAPAIRGRVRASINKALRRAGKG